MATQAWEMLRKYRKTQLDMEDEYHFRRPVTMDTATPEQKKAIQKQGIPGRRMTLSPSGEIVMKSPYDANVVSDTKGTFNRRRFNFDDKTWRVKPGDVDQGTLAEFAEKHGFRVAPEIFEALNKAEEEKAARAAAPEISTPYDGETIGFGKYRDLTFAELAKEDPGYLEWLSEEAMKPKVREAAKMVFDAKERGIEPPASAIKDAAQARPASREALLAAQANTTLKIPSIMKGGALDTKGWSLHDFQKSGVNWMDEVKSGILADEMGLGKTVQAITLTGALKDRGEATGGMFIVPNTLIHNWHQEVKLWAPGAKVVIIDGPPKKREAAYAEIKANGADFIIAPYSMLQREPEKLKAANGPKVVKFYDEGIRLKGWKTKTHQNAKGHLTDGRSIIMTATPIPNRPEELYSQMRLVQPDVLGSFASFKKNYCITESVHTGGGHYVEAVVGYRDLSGLRDKVAPYIRMKRKSDPDVKISMPPVQHLTPSLEMTPKQQRVYKALARQTLKDVRVAMRSQGEGQKNILTLLLRMRQAVLSPELVDPSVKDSPKLDHVASAISAHHNQHPDKGIVVFSEFNGAFPLLRDRLKAMGYADRDFGTITGEVTGHDRSSAQDAFNEGRTKVLLVATKAGGEGLNLQKNANAVVHLSTPWNMALLNQATARVDRQGQKDPVTVLRPLMNAGIEHKIEEVIMAKEALSAQILGYDGHGADSIEAAGLDAEGLLAMLEEEAK